MGKVFNMNLRSVRDQLQPGGQPPDNGDMETRVAKLEDFAVDTRDRLGRVEDRLTRVEVKLDHIDKEVSNFKWWLLGAILTIIVTVLGTSIGIQQMTVATFQGAAQVAKDSAPAAQSAPPPTIIINNIPPAVAAPASAPR